MSFRSLLYASLAIASLASSETRAQLSLPDDSLLYHLDREVVVTATRMPTPFRQAPASTEVYSRDEIVSMPARNVGDVLGRAQGVVLQKYGGEGSLDLASFRGLGPEYTVVFLNGLRLNDAQNGLVDVGRIALMNVGRIEVARGGYAALYGSEALGGIVDIRTGAGAPPFSLRAGGGSFGWKSADAGLTLGGNAARLHLAALYEEGRNDYSFVSPRAPSGRFVRSGAKYVLRRANAEGVAAFERSSLSLYASAGSTRTGVPGAFTQVDRPAAQQRDEDASIALQYRAQLHPSLLLEVSPSYRFARQEYFDPSIPVDGAPLESRYDNGSASLAASLLAELGGASRILGGVEAGRATLGSADIAGTPRRVTAAAYASAELRWSGLPGLALFPSLRIDHLADAPSGRVLDQGSPSLGAVWSPVEDVLTIRARASRGFRAPTFNQLFWKQGGNPALRPEYSSAFEAGAHVAGGRLLPDLDVTVYQHDISDKIVWMPGAGFYWTPKNVRAVRSQGAEARLNGEAFGGVALWSLGAQLIHAVKRNADFPGDATAGKQLVYTPLLGGSASLDLRPVAWGSLSILTRYVGERYSSETNNPESRLDGFVSVDLAASATLAVQSSLLTLKAEVLNALDASYEVIAMYPMPPRALRLSLSFHLPSAETTP